MTATTHPTTVDTHRAEAFAERLLGAINDAALVLMTSIGHRTGLFDVLATLEPSSPDEIAAAAGLDERYVREWLGALTVGGVIEHDPAARTYHLPPEHAAFLTRAAGPDNMATFTQYAAVLGSVEDPIVRCFREGGGVPYSAFTRFHEVMAEESGQGVVDVLEERFLPLVPGLRERLEAGIDVLDVGCGRGRAMAKLARLFPNSRFTGYDVSEEAIATGRQEAGDLPNLRLATADVAALEERAAFDLVTAFDAIHDQADPARVLANVAQALRPDGTFFMVDIQASSHLHENLDHPIGTFLYTISTLHCMTVSLAQGGAGLGTCWGQQQAQKMLAEAGFTSVDVRQIPNDIQNVIYLARRA